MIGVGLSEQAPQIIVPSAPKTEKDVGDAAEKRLEGLRLLSSRKG